MKEMKQNFEQLAFYLFIMGEHLDKPELTSISGFTVTTCEAIFTLISGRWDYDFKMCLMKRRNQIYMSQKLGATWCEQSNKFLETDQW